MNNIRAVAFDLDGTLYPSWQMSLSSIHLVLFHPRLLSAFSRARKEIRRIRPIKDFRKTQAHLVAGYMKIGDKEAYDLIDRKMYNAWKKSFRCIRPFPHCAETVRELKNRGLKLAVLSDFPVEYKLKYLGIDSVWDVVCDSEYAGYLKPNPEPFLWLSERLGLSTAEILYVGNSYHYDIVGARRTGMMTAHMTRKVPLDSVADFSFSRFDKLLDFLEGRVPSSLSEGKGRVDPGTAGGLPKEG